MLKNFLQKNFFFITIISFITIIFCLLMVAQNPRIIDESNRMNIFAISNEFGNAIRSIYDYSFKLENDTCTSLLYNQKFFDDHVLVRSLEKKFFSFLVRYIFFTDSDSLEIMSGQHPFLEESEITKRCMLIPGGYDIGKHFRTLEFPFILRGYLQ